METINEDDCGGRAGKDPNKLNTAPWEFRRTRRNRFVCLFVEEKFVALIEGVSQMQYI